MKRPASDQPTTINSPTDPKKKLSYLSQNRISPFTSRVTLPQANIVYLHDTRKFHVSVLVILIISSDAAAGLAFVYIYRIGYSSSARGDKAYFRKIPIIGTREYIWPGLSPWRTCPMKLGNTTRMQMYNNIAKTDRFVNFFFLYRVCKFGSVWRESLFLDESFS